ncbi:MAG: hypothetical protein IPM93_30635 [Candidatus Obscuribacter sp.]|nr:hypothetical protein [Candidatus Obscuribacter sp.]
MNQESTNTINANNAARALSSLHDQESMLKLVAGMYSDISEEADTPALRFLIAGLYTSGAVQFVIDACTHLVESGEYAAAEKLFDLICNHYDAVQLRLAAYNDTAMQVLSATDEAILNNVAELEAELALLKSLVSTLDARVKIQNSVSGASVATINQLFETLSLLVGQAEESVLVGTGQAEKMFTDEKIAAVVTALVGQIMDSCQADDEETALSMVDDVLGATVEDKRNFLIADSLAHGMVGSKNVQEGAALSAKVELSLAGTVAALLDSLLPSGATASVTAPAVAVVEEEVDPVTAMLLEAEGNLGKPIVVEKDGLLG